MKSSCRQLYAVVMSCLIAAPAFSQSLATTQPAASPEDEKEAAAMRKAAARAKETEAFFAAPEPFDVTFTTNIKRIRGDKDDKAPWRSAVFTYTDAGGKTVSIPAQIRTRGIWRLKNCEFPPLRLNFRNEDTKGTLLNGMDKPKLVNFCRDTDQFENYIKQELQVYRIYSLLTPASHRARLMRITYVDSASGKTHAKRYGIMLEEGEMVAARLGGPLIEQKGALPNNLDTYHDVLAGVFHYFIGNTDWSTHSLHNMELVGEADGDYVPIPYDFDFAGVINAAYATVDPSLSIPSVRQRLYRGFCHSSDDYTKAFATFNDKKEAIFGLYTDAAGASLPSRTVSETLKYFEDFYSTINDPKRAKKNIMDACVKPR